MAEHIVDQSAGRIKQEPQLIAGEFMIDHNQLNGIPINVPDHFSSSVNGLSNLEHSTGRIKEDQVVHGESTLAGNKFNDSPSRSTSDLRRTCTIGTSKFIVCGLSATGKLMLTTAWLLCRD